MDWIKGMLPKGFVPNFFWKIRKLRFFHLGLTSIHAVVHAAFTINFIRRHRPRARYETRAVTCARAI